jgi:hypothetical protein
VTKLVLKEKWKASEGLTGRWLVQGTVAEPEYQGTKQEARMYRERMS